MGEKYSDSDVLLEARRFEVRAQSTVTYAEDFLRVADMLRQTLYRCRAAEADRDRDRGGDAARADAAKDTIAAVRAIARHYSLVGWRDAPAGMDGCAWAAGANAAAEGVLRTAGVAAQQTGSHPGGSDGGV